MPLGGGEKCQRCGYTVYEAEKKTCSGRPWHKKCFSCKECGKKLDSTTVNENKEENDIYCKGCYAKMFGPKGYGFGSGAGTLHLTGQTC